LDKKKFKDLIGLMQVTSNTRTRDCFGCSHWSVFTSDKQNLNIIGC